MTNQTITKAQLTCAEDLRRILVQTGEDGTLRFETGDCVFSGREAEQETISFAATLPGERNVFFTLKHKKNLVLDFQNALLSFDGWTTPFVLEDCENITLKNLRIDRPIASNAEAEVLQASPNRFTMRIDGLRYPYTVSEGKLLFADTDGTQYDCWALMEFDRKTLRTRPETADKLGCPIFTQNPDGTVTAEGDFPTSPLPGNRLVLRRGIRTQTGIFCGNCQGLRFENICLYNSCGVGFVCQFCRDLTFDRVQIVPNEAAGRYIVSTHDDGIQCVNCRGEIQIDGCRFRGMMDDCVNIHGTSTAVEQVSGTTVRGRFMERCSADFSLYALPGDEILFSNRETLNVLYRAAVQSFRLLSREQFELTFAAEVPGCITDQCSMENLSATPGVCIRNSEFLSGRARGLLVTTPKKVLIENNRFDTSGSAILCSGDANYWYESGACKDVTIRKNTFTAHCCSGSYQFCEGVISFCPVIPRAEDSPGYHENVRITGNHFAYNGKNLCYALCTNHITFAENEVRNETNQPPHDYCRFEYCRP